MVFKWRCLRRRANSSNAWYMFNLLDCPAYLYRDALFLAAQENSPILRADSVVRGHPRLPLFEGDYVSNPSGEFLGYVVFDAGFCVKDERGKFLETVKPNYIYMRGDSSSIDVINSIKRTPILFRYNDYVFDFGSFIKANGDNLVLFCLKKFLEVPVSCIQPMFSGERFSDESIFIGDTFKGQIITEDTHL